MRNQLAMQEVMCNKVKCVLWFVCFGYITIMTDQHQHHDCEDDITMFDIIKVITQL